MSPDAPNKPSGFLGRFPRWGVWAVAGVTVLLVVAMAVGVAATSRTGYYGRYEAYRHSADTLKTSGHKNLTCTQCHADSRGGLLHQVALVGDFYAGLISRSDEPRFAKLAKPTRQACLACHTYEWSMDSKKTAKVPHPAHLRVASEKRDCVTCHRWTGHEETYQEKHKAMPFSTVCASFPCHVGTKPARDCQNCHHQLQQSLGEWKTTHPKVVRAYGQNACLEKCHVADQCRECHTTGRTPAFATTIAASTVTAIEKAHVKSDWLTQHGTFALQDQSKCLTCHVTLGECQDCHAKRPAFHGTDTTKWIGTHKDFAKDKRRCLTCHEQSWCDDCHKQFKEMR